MFHELGECHACLDVSDHAERLDAAQPHGWYFVWINR
jgi:hypothetical protein